jgi:hypothetical protein
MIHSFEEFRRKLKGKDVCSSSELVSVAMDSMMEPKSSMMVGLLSHNQKLRKRRRRPSKMAKLLS